MKDKIEVCSLSFNFSELSIIKASLEGCNYSGKDVIPVSKLIEKITIANDKIKPEDNGL